MRLYLDNAATTFPKPPRVYEAMMDYATRVGASPGRGQYAEAREGERVLRRCRDRISRLINAEGPERVVFALNTSDALNLAIRGVVGHRLRACGEAHVVASAMDHNSVLRVLNGLARASEGRVRWTCVPADEATGRVDADAFDRALERSTALACCVHASNVTGTIQPIGEIARATRRRGVPLLVDAAQSLGHVPVDVRALGVDLLAFPGHKGLLGPQGTGGLYVREGVEREMSRVREGGTGSWSESDEHPDEMPTRFEAGSHNTMGLAGLGEGVEYLLERGAAAVRAHEVAIMEAFLDGVAGLGPEFRLLGPTDAGDRVGVFSHVHERLTAHEVAGMLEGEGVLVRAGIHCAPRAHATMGTLGAGDSGGAARLSFGVMNTVGDARRAIEALARIARQRGGSPGATSTHCPSSCRTIAPVAE